jgi:hypothetical protein
MSTVLRTDNQGPQLKSWESGLQFFPPDRVLFLRQTRLDPVHFPARRAAPAPDAISRI